MRKRLGWLALTAVAALSAAYCATAARFALGGDGGEFAALALRGGVAHPPGYPAFVLFLRSAAWIPVAEGAHRAAIATSLLGVLAAWLVFRTAVSFGATSLSAALASAIYASSPLTWKISTYPEVFAGNACIALAIAWCAGPAPPARGAARAALLGLLAGLGLAHHHSIVLMAPLGLYGVGVAVRESPRRTGAAWSAAVAFVAGLLPYGYLVLAARGTFGQELVLWGDTSTAEGLLHHFLRRDYGTTRLGAQGHDRQPVEQLLLFATTLTRDFAALPVVLGTAIAAARRRVLGGKPQVLLLASFVLAGPLFVTAFNMPPQGIRVEILERFHLMPAALAVVLVAPAFDAVFSRMKPAIAALAVCGVFAAQAALALPIVADHHRGTVQRYAENVLAVVEPRAIVVGGGDHRASSFLYAGARGLRPDVEFVQPWLVLSDAYRRRLSAKLGLEVVAPVNHILDANALMAQLLATGRPVYVTDWPTKTLEKSFATYPLGPVLRVVPDRHAVPGPAEVLERNERAFERITLDASPPVRRTWAGLLYDDYARPWRALSGAFRAAGETELADACDARAAALAPR